MKYYVVTSPESARGIYESWAECRPKVNGVSGARFQSVDSRSKAEALLGDGIVLRPGTYAFTDGNAEGGVGVVLLERGEETTRVRHEVGTSIAAVTVPPRSRRTG